MPQDIRYMRWEISSKSPVSRLRVSFITSHSSAFPLSTCVVLKRQLSCVYPSCLALMDEWFTSVLFVVRVRWSQSHPSERHIPSTPVSPPTCVYTRDWASKSQNLHLTAWGYIQKSTATSDGGSSVFDSARVGAASKFEYERGGPSPTRDHEIAPTACIGVV